MNKSIFISSLSPALQKRIIAELKDNQSLARVDLDDKLILKLLKAHNILGEYLDFHSRTYNSTAYFAINQKIYENYDPLQPYLDKTGEKQILMMWDDHLYHVFNAFREDLINDWQNDLQLKAYEAPEITAQGRANGWLCFKLDDLRPELYTYLINTFHMNKLLVSIPSSKVIELVEDEGYTRTDIDNLYKYSVALKAYLEKAITDVKQIVKNAPANFVDVLKENDF